jgi:uncharacterized protein YbcI
MKLSQMSLGQRIAKAVRDFEQLRMHRVREWVVVLLNEETVVIAAYGSLSAAESVLASKPAGYARVTESNRQLYASTPLLQK